MSIQLLIENASKHNIVSVEHPLTIMIVADEKGVSVSHPLQPRNHVDKSGYGLDILRQQYAIHKQDFLVEKRQGKYHVFLPYVCQ